MNTVLASITAKVFKEFADAIEAGATPKSVAQKALKDSWKVRERERQIDRERENERERERVHHTACLPFYNISALIVILALKVTNLHLDYSVGDI